MSWARAKREFTSWWKAKIFSRGLAKNRGFKTCPSLDTSGLSLTIQNRIKSFGEPTKTSSLGSPIDSNFVLRSVETRGIGNVDTRTGSEAVYHTHGSGRGRVLFEGLSRSQKVRWVPIGDRSVSTEQVVSSDTVQHGHIASSETSVEAGNVGNVARPIRCISPHSDATVITGISLFPSRRRQIQIPSATIRSELGTLAVHGSSQTGKEMGMEERFRSVSVPRRLAQSRSRQGSPPRVDAKVGDHLSRTRAVSEHSKVRTSATTGNRVPRGKARLDSRQSFRHRGTTDKGEESCGGNGQLRPCVVTTGGITTGITGCNISDGAMGSPPPEAATGGDDKGTTQGQSVASTGKSNRVDAMSPEVLAATGSVDTRSTIPSSGGKGNPVHRRFSTGLGSSMQRSNLRRTVAGTYAPTHKLVRVESSVNSVDDLSIPMPQQISSVHDRQLHGSSICQSPRRDKVETIDGTDVRGGSSSEVNELHSQGKAHCRESKRSSRLSFTGRTSDSIRMEAIPRGFRMGMQPVSMGQARLGTVRQQYESPPRQVRVAVSGSKGVGNGRDNVRTASAGDNVCLSSTVSDGKVSTTISASTTIPSAASNALDATRGMDATTQPVDTTPVAMVPNVSSASSATTLEVPASTPRTSKPVSDVFGKERLRELGYSEEVIKKLELSHASSTRRQYRSKWTLFVAWSSQQTPPLDPTSPSEVAMAGFLTHLFDERKISVGAIRNYRSAITYHWRRLSGYNPPQDDHVMRDLFNSFVRDRPVVTKKVVDWDIRLVLEFFMSGKFASWSDVSPREATLKTVFLVALASGKRRSEIHALTRDGIRETFGVARGKFIDVKSGFLSKTHVRTSGRGQAQPIFLPALVKEDDALHPLCPSTAVDEYLRLSDKYRSKEQGRLFISYQEGQVKDVTTQTISSYIRQAIILAYENSAPGLLSDLEVRPHSVRSVATSLRAIRSSSLDEVLSVGTWTSTNAFIKYYLTDYSTDTVTGLSRLGGFVAGGAIF